MNEDTFNMSIRKYLKTVGVHSQHEFEGLAGDLLVRIGVALVRHADLLEQLQRARLDLGPRALLDLERRDRDVAEHRHVLEQVILLEYDGHLVAQCTDFARTLHVDDLPADLDHTATGAMQSDQAAQNGRLAGPGRSDQRKDIALLDGKAYIFDNLKAAKMHAKISDCEVRQAVSPDTGPAS